MTSPLLGCGALPTTVEIGGRAWPIRHDFRDGIRFESLMFDARLPSAAKVPLALGIWFPTVPDADLGEVIAAMLTFYRCGKPDTDEPGDDERLYSYDHDWDAIFAGFLTCYGLDLLGEDVTLHWWKFRSMLAALPADSSFMRVVGYRGARISSDMPKEQRRFLTKMKRLHALPASDGMRPVRIRDEASLQKVLDAVRRAKGETP